MMRIQVQNEINQNKIPSFGRLLVCNLFIIIDPLNSSFLPQIKIRKDLEIKL